MYAKVLPILGLLVSTMAPAAEDLVVTQISSLTHPVTNTNATGLNTGFKVFFAGVNARGGIHGRKVVLTVKDDNYNPEKTLALAKEAVQDPKTIALFGVVGTANVGAIVKSNLLPENNIALMGPATGIPAQLGAPNVFPIRASYNDQLLKIAKHAGTLQRKRIAFLHIDSPLAPELKKVFEGALQADGKQLVAAAKIDTTPDGAQLEKNARNAVAQAEAGAPDTYVIFGPGNATPAAIKTIREKHGDAVMIYALIPPTTAMLVDMIGQKNAAGLMIAQIVPRANDTRFKIVKDYLSDFARHAPDEKPSGLTLEGYLGARILYEGLLKAGPNPTRASLANALNDLGKVNIGDFEVDYNRGRKVGYNAVEMTMVNRNGVLIH
jgi:branched-chain amino acid transport system substrate-binding protein